MNSKRQNFLVRVGMLALAVFLALPMTALAQDVYRGRDRDRNNNEWRRQEELRRQQAERARLEELRRQEEWRRQQARNRGNDDWRNRNDNDRGRRGRDWGGYGTHGGSFQLRQTALNAGYNNGIQEGRKDRQRGERFEFRDEGDYSNATEDYNSRFGNRELYRRYFRDGFANGYRDGYNGY